VANEAAATALLHSCTLALFCEVYAAITRPSPSRIITKASKASTSTCPGRRLNAGRPVMQPCGRSGRLSSSRPHHCPHRTSAPVVRKIVRLRLRQRSPLAIASRPSMPASTVDAVLVQCQLNLLSHIDIRIGDTIRRSEHGYPGSLMLRRHQKLGNIPVGGGWRFVGRDRDGCLGEFIVVDLGLGHPEVVIDDSVDKGVAEKLVAASATPHARSGCAILAFLGCYTAPWVGSARAACGVNACCLTTAAATSRVRARRCAGHPSTTALRHQRTTGKSEFSWLSRGVATWQRCESLTLSRSHSSAAPSLQTTIGSARRSSPI
jgi:hypothetical protein